MSIDLSASIQNEAMEHVYQPIWDLNNSYIFGYEALVRFPDGFCDGNIEKTFELARKEGYLYELDTKSISLSVQSFPLDRLENELLFVNVYPSTLLHEQFEWFICQLLNQYPKIQGHIVFELNESIEEEDFWEKPLLKERFSFLRACGFYIAFDDVGTGAASFQKIIEFSPDYIKLDRYFAKELNRSKEKQDIISLILQYAKEKMVLILEGIEEEVDLAQAKRLNVPVAQGYFLGRPQKLIENPFQRMN